MAFAALALSPGCATDATSTDGNTSWLKCPRGCDDGYECVRGQCVVAKTMPIAPRDGGGARAPASDGGMVPTSPSNGGTAPTASTAPSAGGIAPTSPSGGGIAPTSPSGGGMVPTSPQDAGSVPSPPRDGGGLSSVPQPPDAAPPDPVQTGTGLANCTSLTDPRGGKGPAISFRNDILPIFGLDCVTSDCHDPQYVRAGLYLGHNCAYDANAKWKCSFPSNPNPDPVQPQPDDEQTVAAVYAGLLAPAQTVTSPTVYRVKPGDPENSFLVLSLANQQNSRGYMCVNQDPSHEVQPPPCGVQMPQNQDSFCTGISQPRFDAIVEWIAQGAPNN
jgi:hypothetical protein